MPELPEVETVCRSIQALTKQKFQKIIIRQPQLRWKIPSAISKTLPGIAVEKIHRRAKYLLLETKAGTLIIHLGMSGYLTLTDKLQPPQKHDHVDFIFDNLSLRYTDPRRFGAILWANEGYASHPQLATLGPEPLSTEFNAQQLLSTLHNKKVAIKIALMNSKIVSGIGNIYAAESLFLAGINPNKPSNQISLSEAQSLCNCVKEILQKAITAGGTTLKDFQSSDGKLGYFSQQLNVYGREQQPCVKCSTLLEKLVLGQRATVFCPSCQKMANLKFT